MMVIKNFDSVLAWRIDIDFEHFTGLPGTHLQFERLWKVENPGLHVSAGRPSAGSSVGRA
jgi:hypothetical protein